MTNEDKTNFAPITPSLAPCGCDSHNPCESCLMEKEKVLAKAGVQHFKRHHKPTWHIGSTKYFLSGNPWGNNIQWLVCRFEHPYL